MAEHLIQGYLRFREGYFKEHQAELNALTEGQAPKVAVVSCCDSRVDPSIVFDADPGDLFVIRNVANLVPPWELDGKYHGTSAALEFAVLHLGVEHIVVLGHAHCGGIKLLLDEQDLPPEQQGTSFLHNWVSIARPVFEALAPKHEYRHEEDRLHACEMAAVRQSIRNLESFPFIAERVKGGRLHLHGWYYDLATSTIHRLKDI